MSYTLAEISFGFWFRKYKLTKILCAFIRVIQRACPNAIYMVFLTASLDFATTQFNRNHIIHVLHSKRRTEEHTKHSLNISM